ncbi:MAG: hypothetical protein ABFS17_09365 [Chloroflexota bacterium]
MKTTKLITLLIAIGLLAMVITGCAQNNTTTNQGQGQSNPANSNENQPAGTSGDQEQDDGPPDMAAIERAWQNSAHAATFLVDDNGQNNSCAQCHAPINWKPSMDTIPESCFTCKFELEDPPPYIAEADWENIPCKVCHELNKRDEVQPEYKWLAIAPIDEYASVDSTTELCQKCHTAEEPMEGHVWVSIEGLHQDQTCTDCHNAHDDTASCITCHNELDFSASETAGHDPDHENISCIICHDGSGLAASLNTDTNLWELLSETPDGIMVISNTHNIALEAQCSSCHYANNPWELSVQP